MAKKINKAININKRMYVLLLFFATIFMSIGYASVNKEFVSIDGSAGIISNNSFYIRTVNYDSDSGADVNSSQINDFSNMILNSSITLGNSQSSTITYAITINNTTNKNYAYSGTSYSNNFYDNPNITYTISSLSVGDTIYANSSKTFYINFSYAGSNTSNPTLNSYIVFNFDTYYSITYQNINTTGQNYPTRILASETSKTITFNGDVPYDVSITPSSINYTYNNGVLTLNNVDSNVSINRYYSITYVTNGTNPSGQPTKYLHGATVSFQNPTDGNNRFDGWYLNSGYTGNSVTSTSGLTGDITLYALWTPAYTITYVLNGGVQANNQITYFYSDDPQNILDPTNTHDPLFSGWFDNSGFTGTAKSSTSDLTGNTTLYANWTSTINNATYDTSNNRFVASNVSDMRLSNFTSNSYTQGTTHTTINSVKISITYNGGNQNATLNCEVAGQQTSFTLQSGQNNAVVENTITLNTSIQSGGSYTVSCPSYSGDKPGKVRINGLAFTINP